MSASQGREGRKSTRTRLGRLGAALAVSGLHLAVGAGPAQACHIHHRDEARDLAPSHANPDNGARDFQNLMHLLQQVKDQAAASQAAPPVTTTSATTAKAPAAEILPTATAASGPRMPVIAAGDVIAPPVTHPTVANWHQGQASHCPPPPPPCSGPMTSGGSTSSGSSPKAPLAPPAAQTLPTPEPSTILTASLLAGGFAWRRRSSRRPQP